jgi:diketogulonate reductase-like aldo/keto reductase
VHGDVGETLRAVLPLLEQRTDRRYLDRMLRDHATKLARVVEAYTRDIEHHVPIHPEYAARVLDEVATEDAVFTVDTGMCNVWAARYITPNGRRRVIGSFRHGSMANALPQAVGAQLADPERNVISMSGDGGLEMLLGELITVRQHELPVKIVTFNNSSLGMVKLEMLVDGMPDFQTDHPTVDHDLCQVHWPDPATPLAETAAALDRLVAEGKIRHVGVSNFDVDQIAEFSRTRPVETAQPPYHLFRRDIGQDLLPYARSHDIGVLAYGPLAHGLLTGTMDDDTTFAKDDWRSTSPPFRGHQFRDNLRAVADLRQFAAERGHSVAALAIAWVLGNPAVEVAIVGARRPAHLADAVTALELRLDSEDFAAIDRIMAGAVPVGGASPDATP